MFQVYSVCMHALCEMRRAFGHHQNHSKPIAPLCGEKRHDNQNITYGDIKKGQSYNNLLHSKNETECGYLYIVYYTTNDWCISGSHAGCWYIQRNYYEQCIFEMQREREIIFSITFMSLLTDTFSLSNSSTGSSLSSSVIVVREMWFALSR